MLRNLLSNAVKYSPAGAPVRLRAHCTAEHAILDVSDRGIGIPEAEAETVFRAFERGSNATQPGTGLGLLIARRCAELHGGTVSLHRNDDDGVTARITLPLILSTHEH